MQKIITLIIFFAFQISLAQSASEYNAGAISAFNAGNYAQAKDYFEQSLAQADTAKTNYNLANTCEKLGEIGKAKAYYMRAIYQDPRLKEAVFNLNALDKKYALSPYNTSNSDFFFDELSHNEWIVILAISLWLVSIFFIVLPLLKIYKAWQSFLGLIFSLSSVLSAFGVSYWHSYANTAISLSDNAPLKLSPTPTSDNIYTAKQAQVFCIKKQQGNFYLLQDSNKKAWTPLDDINFMRVIKR